MIMLMDLYQVLSKIILSLVGFSSSNFYNPRGQCPKGWSLTLMFHVCLAKHHLLSLNCVSIASLENAQTIFHSTCAHWSS